MHGTMIKRRKCDLDTTQHHDLEECPNSHGCWLSTDGNFSPDPEPNSVSCLVLPLVSLSQEQSLDLSLSFATSVFFESAVQLFRRMSLHPGWSVMSSWLDFGYAFGARTPLKQHCVLSLSHQEGHGVHAVNVDCLEKAESTHFLPCPVISLPCVTNKYSKERPPVF